MTPSFLTRLLLQSSITLLPACLLAQTGLPFPLPPHQSAMAVSAAEYFFDTDPGWGNAISIPLGTAPGNTVTTSLPVSLSSLNPGVHQLYTRVKDAQGRWSLTNRKSLFIINPGFTVPAHNPAAAITQAEFFINTDPGLGNGTPLTLTPGTDITIANAAINISGLANGTHNVYFRSKDAGGRWSLTNRKSLAVVVTNISIPAHPVADNIKSIEYFVDTDPGWGNGMQLNVPPNGNLTNLSITVNTSTLSDGYHYLHIRTLGNRSLTNVKAFQKGAPLPVDLLAFEVALTGNDAGLNWEVAKPHEAVQFEIERSKDGILFDNIAAGVHAENEYRFTATDKEVTRLQSPKLYYRLKIKGTDNQYTYSPVIAVRLHPEPGSFIASAAPNPFSGSLTLQSDLPAAGMMELWWMDISGRVVLTDKVMAAKGFTTIKLHTPSLPEGSYILQVRHGNEYKNLKLIKRQLP